MLKIKLTQSLYYYGPNLLTCVEILKQAVKLLENTFKMATVSTNQSIETGLKMDYLHSATRLFQWLGFNPQWLL